MSSPTYQSKTAAIDDFQWTVQPLAERMVQDILEAAVGRSPFVQDLKRRMRDETGTRLFDWLDHVVVADTGGLRESLRNAGFIGRFAAGAGETFVHEEGIFPTLIPSHDGTTRLGIKVESVADYLAAGPAAVETEIEGEPLAPMRQARVASENDVEVWVIERHGYRGFNVLVQPPEKAQLVLKHAEAFRTRR